MAVNMVTGPYNRLVWCTKAITSPDGGPVKQCRPVGDCAGWFSDWSGKCFGLSDN